MLTSKPKVSSIPIVGLGTWALRGRDCARLTEQAIRIGYRHIDTAQMYDNEREVGEGVRASGLRAEVMVTTKVQPTLLAAARFRTLGQGKPGQAASRRHRSAADPLAKSRACRSPKPSAPWRR